MKRRSVRTCMLVLIAAVFTVGCTQDRQSVQSAAAKEAQQPQLVTLVIPDGTNVIASLDTRISTDVNHTGDSFAATTIEPIMVDGRTAVPAGARIHGTLQDLQASGRTSGRARMTLTYHGITDSEGKNYTISALPLTLQAASATRGDVEKIAAGGVLGAIIGGIAGGEKGAVIGAGAGAGAGTVIMLATKGDEVELEMGQKLNVQLTSSTTIQVLAQK